MFGAEPIVEYVSMPFKVWQQCGLKFVATNSRDNKKPSFWVYCRSDVDTSAVSDLEQQLAVDARFQNKRFRIASVC